MTRNMVAGNWKMFKSPQEAHLFAESFQSLLASTQLRFPVGIFPNYLSIPTLVTALQGTGNVFVGAQNCHEQDEGAFTGETSAAMVRSAGASHVLVGHSERREYYSESGAQLLAKTRAAIRNGLTPVFCCGEKLEDRKAGLQNQVIQAQLDDVVGNLSEDEIANTVIAYEPVWAIGTGETASPEQAQEVHEFIRNYLTNRSAELSASTTILYGGSVKPGNARELFSQPDIDGGLIGGASLKPEDFFSIVATMNAMQ